ncbi:hypothetical protein GTA08_BOTSDO08573 [Neofusicoccum parvum]|uniref:Uncharacterized protein n=2 Tax=Neofusicoccum parvum TaxID=310453 RepID=R1EAJ4_BOTPV|nr:hypothetical protein UCRNP2_8838 [Neofusicoccum parvum UCRNP2]GME31709.1 hypothetical protein GTA08_BOTSDO08573 [Neofusicoccum parvum]GME52272.1 hypothetical protein GTA08_BOTSDO08573 [Neofusicoccum parvum]
MKFSLAAAVIAAVAAPALAAHEASTTVTISPCPSSTASVADIVTRSPVPMASQSTPCPTLHTVMTNGTTVTMSHAGAGTPGSTGTDGSSTASATPSSFTGAAANNHAAFGGAVAAALGFAVFVL